MSLSGVPEGFLSIGEAVGLVGRRIREAINNDLATLKTVLDPDAVEKGPPAALFDAGYHAFLKPIGQDSLEVFTLHPASGERIRVPAYLFLSAKAPRMLFYRPSLHAEAGAAEDFAPYIGRPLFVEKRDATVIAERAADDLLSKAGINWVCVEDLGRRSPSESWKRTAAELQYWPITFGLIFLQAGQDITKAIDTYAALLETSDEQVILRACYVGSPSLPIIEEWAKTGRLAVFGRAVRRYGDPGSSVKIEPLEWMNLRLRFDYPVSARRLYASRDRPVPLSEWWEDLHVERKQFLEILLPSSAATRPLGRPPKRQALAREVATKLWGSAEWPPDITQDAARTEINEWLRAETKRRQSEGVQSPTLQELSLGTLRAALRKPKKSS